jgi:hypothetical protein
MGTVFGVDGRSGGEGASGTQVPGAQAAEGVERTMEDASERRVSLHGGDWLVVPQGGDEPSERALRQLRLWTRSTVDAGVRRGNELPGTFGGAVGTLAEFVVAGLVGNAAYANFPDAVDYMRALVSVARSKPVRSAEDLSRRVRSAARSIKGRKPQHVEVISAKRHRHAWTATCQVDGEVVDVTIDTAGLITVWTPRER